MKIRNFTGHDINIYNPSGTIELLRFQSEGMARVNYIREYDGVFCPDHGPSLYVPVSEIVEREIKGLPAPAKDVMYIVTNMVFDSSDRIDLLCPDELVRDENHCVKGCSSLRRRTVFNS